jgi:hypothetical protein
VRQRGGLRPGLGQVRRPGGVEPGPDGVLQEAALVLAAALDDGVLSGI